MRKFGNASIPNGASSVTVAFDEDFESVPVVIVTVEAPEGLGLVQGNVRKGSISVSGFIVDLSSAVPSGSYIIEWKATV